MPSQHMRIVAKAAAAMPYRDIAYLAGKFRGQGVSGGLLIFKAGFERKYPEVMAALAGLDFYEREFAGLLVATLPPLSGIVTSNNHIG